MPQSRPYHGAELWKPPLGKSAQQEPVAQKAPPMYGAFNLDIVREWSGWTGTDEDVVAELKKLFAEAAIEKFMSQPAQQPTCSKCGVPIGGVHAADCGWPRRVTADDCKQPAQQEPVAWIDMSEWPPIRWRDGMLRKDIAQFHGQGLYTAPPQRKPLTDWVAVSDRLPAEEDGEVLVKMRDGRCEIAWATYWHGASNDFAQWTFRDPDEDEAPTHWMLIPAARGIKEGA